MGHDTRFNGKFKLDKELSISQYNELKEFAETRHENMEGSTGLYCQWVPCEDGKGIEWDGNEGFYNYGEWLIFIITNFIDPWGHVLNGKVSWIGENSIEDSGVIIVVDNAVQLKTTVMEGKLNIAIEALKKIATPEGPYSTDPLKFAQNVIDSVTKIAKEALEKVLEEITET